MDRMLEGLLAVVGVALVASLAAGAWLFFERRDAENKVDDLQVELEAEQAKAVDTAVIDAAVAAIGADWTATQGALAECLASVEEVADTLYEGAIDGTAGPLFALIVDDLRAQQQDTCAAFDAVDAEMADKYPDLYRQPADS